MSCHSHLHHSCSSQREQVLLVQNANGNFIERIDMEVEDEISCSSLSSIGTTSTVTYKTNSSLQKRIDTAFSEIRSFKDGGDKAIQITNALLFMIVKDSLPLDSTEKDGFKYFIKMALPHYAVPGRTKITYLLDNKFDALKCIAKAQISEVNCLSITADIWTETTNTRSFLGATAHYIHNYKFCNVFICLEELDAAHTAEYIKERLLNVCEDWNIAVPKIAALITDNGANITKASADLVGKSRNLPCFSHTLNLVASKVCDIENIAPLVSSVKAIVTFFRQSVSAADELRKVTNLRPIASVPTRWNSTYFMLQRFMDIRNEIGTVLLKFPRSPRMLTAAELQQVEEVLQLLSPLEQASTEMCGEKYVTASKIIPLVNILQKQFSALHLETQNGQCMKTTLLQELKKRFGKMEEVQLLSIATLLDPRSILTYCKI
jgi:hypothetical protein